MNTQIMDRQTPEKELFEFDKPKRSFANFNNMLPKNDFAIALTLERIIFISIGVIMLLVLVFALGVEKGKSINRRAERVMSKPVRQIQPQATIATVITQAPSAQIEKAPEARPVQVETNIVRDTAKPFTVVAAAFSKKERAESEAARLKSKGFDAFIAASEPYFIVCVGAYSSKDNARDVLGKIRKTHKDAYVKLR